MFFFLAFNVKEEKCLFYFILITSQIIVMKAKNYDY